MAIYQLRLRDGANNQDAMRAIRAISIGIGEEVPLSRINEVIFESSTEANTINSIGWGAFRVAADGEVGTAAINYSRRSSRRHAHWAAMLGEWKKSVRMVARIGNGRPAIAVLSGRRDCDAELDRFMAHYVDQMVSVSFSTTDGRVIEEWTSRPFWCVI